MEKELTLRIDKWLWAARFFKTRSLATNAANGGKVSLNGSRIKASRSVRPGDTLCIVKGQFEFIVTVKEISKQRRSASEAQKLYEESPESIMAREEKRDLFKSVYAGEKKPAKKPGKRDRRKIREFTRKE